MERKGKVYDALKGRSACISHGRKKKGGIIRERKKSARKKGRNPIDGGVHGGGEGRRGRLKTDREGKGKCAVLGKKERFFKEVLS